MGRDRPGYQCDHRRHLARRIAKLIAVLTRLVREVGLAEELAQEALVAALEEWPAAGIPELAGAWLMTTAKEPRAQPAAPCTPVVERTQGFPRLRAR